MSETLAETLTFGASDAFSVDVEGGKAYLERLERDGSTAGT